MKKILGVVLSVMLATPAMAYESEHIQSAQKLMVAMDAESQMVGGFEAMLPTIENMAVQMNLSATEMEELKDIYRDWFYNDIDRDKINYEIAKLYADTFSMQEINDIIAFFHSPTGQKLVSKNPHLAQQGAQIGMIEAQNKQQQLIDKLTPFLQKHAPQQ